MYLKNLNALYIDMQKNGADSVVFAAQVEGHPFSCAFATLTHSHPLRSGILALCNKRWLEVFLRNRVEFTAVFELTLDLLNYGLSPFVQQFQ